MSQLAYTLTKVNAIAIDNLFLYGFAESLGTGFGAAFVSAADLPAGATYSTVWQQGLLVLFDSPAPPTADTQAVISLVQSAGAAGVVWVANSANFGGTAPAPAILSTLPFTASGQAAVIAALSFIPVGNSQLGVAANTPVSFDSAALTFHNLSLHAPTVFFATSGGRKFATIGPSVISPDYNLVSSSVTLSLAPNVFGCWQFTLTLEKDTGRNLQSDMQLLDVGLHYYDALAALYYPVLDTDMSSLSLAVTADPLQPTNAARSALTLPGTALPSTFRTRSGNPITLQPGSDAKLLFTPASGGYTVTPSGSFTMGFVEAAPELLCGLTGTEYMKLTAGAVLYFLPGQNAHSPDPTSPTATLDNSQTTAWVSIVPAADSHIDYGLQSSQTLFYQVEQPATPWDVLEIVIAQLAPPTPPQLGDYYPLAPYAGVRQRTNSTALMGPGGLDPDFYLPYQAFETLLLNSRTSVIQWNNQQQSPPPGDEITYGVTAQGLLVQFDSELVQWQKLVLAVGENAEAGNPSILEFDNITGDFQQAMRGDQVFIVMDNTANTLQTPCFTAPDSIIVEFADWTFDFAPSLWTQHGTIAILKYHDLSLIDLVNNTGYWSWPAAAGAATQQALKTIFADVAQQVLTNPNYAYLNQILQNPKWQGILYFNVPMDLDTIPPSLAMLSAGLNPSLFYAHHVGVNITSVVGLKPGSTGLPEMKTSAAFGLINYNDPLTLATQNAYAYKVSQMQVLFLNSLTVNVQAAVQLIVNKLFGHSATLQGSTQGNLINLSGSAQSHDGQMNLMLQSTQTEIFALTGSVIEQVEVDGVQFFSLNSPDTDNPDDNPLVETRFAFDGALKFVQLNNADDSKSAGFKSEAFDFFSFDSLDYQQLRLDMQYPFDNPDLTTFTFDPDEISFVLSQSTARPASLVNQLTLRLSAFTSSLIAPTPQTLNFIPLVVSPFNNTSGTNSIWYGLLCDLPLGTLGALAPDTTLSLEVLLAWSPAASGPGADSMWFGVRIPGANSSGVFFSIEDVIKMGIKQVLLTAGADNGPIITFQSIALTVLGQTIPPGGTTDVTLFGDASGKSDALAWFADYLKKDIPAPAKTQTGGSSGTGEGK